jgi:predicted nucleic acid-binding protein
MVENVGEDLVIPAPVLVEVDHWLWKLYGAEPWASFVEDVARGAYRIHPLDEHDLVRATELESTYQTLDLGLVDAAVIAACERLGETKVATLDRRDFSIVRPHNCERLTLLPR